MGMWVVGCAGRWSVPESRVQNPINFQILPLFENYPTVISFQHRYAAYKCYDLTDVSAELVTYSDLGNPCSETE